MKKGTDSGKIQRRIVGFILEVIFLAALIAVLVYILYLRIELNRQNDINVELKKEILAVTEENRHLRIENESAVSLDALEETAKNELGMQTLKREQIRISDFSE